MVEKPSQVSWLYHTFIIMLDIQYLKKSQLIENLEEDDLQMDGSVTVLDGISWLQIR